MRRTRIWLAAVAALASLAVLVPAGSAQGMTLHGSPFCIINPNGGSQGITLGPGQRCTFFALPTKGFSALWHVTSPGRGAVCGGIEQYPNQTGTNTVIDNGSIVSGFPSAGWVCTNIAGYGSSNWGATVRMVNDPNDSVPGFSWFDSVYGRATIVNYSTTSIRFGNWGGPCRLGQDYQNCIWYYTNP